MHITVTCFDPHADQHFDNISDEFRDTFNSLVTLHATTYVPPGHEHYLLLAREKPGGAPAAFCYFYVPVSKEWCDLFSVYVDPRHEGRGIASSLLERALGEAYEFGARNFTLHWASHAHKGKLFARFRDLERNRYSDCVFCHEPYQAHHTWPMRFPDS